MPNKQNNAKMVSISRLAILKFLELAIAVVCICLHYNSRTRYFEIDMISTVAFGGFIIILLGTFAGHLMRTPINRRIDVFYSLSGCALFMVSGGFNMFMYLHDTESESARYFLAKASLATINGPLFVLDSLLTWRGVF